MPCANAVAVGADEVAFRDFLDDGLERTAASAREVEDLVFAGTVVEIHCDSLKLTAAVDTGQRLQRADGFKISPSRVRTSDCGSFEVSRCAMLVAIQSRTAGAGLLGRNRPDTARERAKRWQSGTPKRLKNVWTVSKNSRGRFREGKSPRFCVCWVYVGEKSDFPKAPGRYSFARACKSRVSLTRRP